MFVIPNTSFDIEIYTLLLVILAPPGQSSLSFTEWLYDPSNQLGSSAGQCMLGSVLCQSKCIVGRLKPLETHKRYLVIFERHYFPAAWSVYNGSGKDSSDHPWSGRSHAVRYGCVAQTRSREPHPKRVDTIVNLASYIHCIEALTIKTGLWASRIPGLRICDICCSCVTSAVKLARRWVFAKGAVQKGEFYRCIGESGYKISVHVALVNWHGRE